jgi:hypothetical protein
MTPAGRLNWMYSVNLLWTREVAAAQAERGHGDAGEIAGYRVFCMRARYVCSCSIVSMALADNIGCLITTTNPQWLELVVPFPFTFLCATSSSK